MKKILSLLGAVTLIGSAVPNVVACASTSTKTARSIADKIKNKSLALPANTDPDTANANTIAMLKQTLQKANSLLNKKDLTRISFAKTTLKDNEQTNSALIATIKVDSSEVNVSLNITIHSTAAQIKAKIKAPTTTIITLAAETNHKLSNAETQKALKTAIANQYQLSNYDKSTISFANANSQILQGAEYNNQVTLNLKDDALPTAGTASVTLAKVQLRATANDIKTKLEAVSRSHVAILNTDTSDNKLSQTNIDKILTIYKQNNSELTSVDKSKLSIAVDLQKSLPANNAWTDVNVTIKGESKEQDASTTIKVARFTTANDIYKNYVIYSKIGMNLTVSIPASSDPLTGSTATTTSLRTAFKAVNPALTSSDIAKMRFRKPTNLTDGETNNTIKVIIQNHSTSSELPFTRVQIHRTRAQIKKLITDIPSQNVDITGAGTIDARIKTALKTAASSLSEWDLDQISIEAGKTINASTRTAVVLTIVDDSSSTTLTKATIKVQSAS